MAIPNMREVALQMIAQNPTISNNPMSKQGINMIQNADDKQGEAYARNLCKSMGISVEDALNMSKQFFGIR